jgi:hypothetical protein
MTPVSTKAGDILPLSTTPTSSLKNEAWVLAEVIAGWSGPAASVRNNGSQNTVWDEVSAFSSLLIRAVSDPWLCCSSLNG